MLADRSVALRKIAFIAVATLALNVPEAFAQKSKAPKTFNIIPITINSVTVEAGQLVATGSVGSTLFTEPLLLTAQPRQAGQDCPVLNLSLGPINLTLLGLNVDTSAICLDITAHRGQGLLGDLLCGISNLLADGTPLSNALASLNATDLATVTRGLTTVLNQALAQVTSSNAVVGSTCSVLSLAVGPLDLNILGLEVELDNCNEGPVTVDVTATAGGGLLGDLLCRLSAVLNARDNAAILNILRQITRLIGYAIG